MLKRLERPERHDLRPGTADAGQRRQQNEVFVGPVDLDLVLVEVVGEIVFALRQDEDLMDLIAVCGVECRVAARGNGLSFLVRPKISVMIALTAMSFPWSAIQPLIFLS